MKIEKVTLGLHFFVYRKSLKETRGSYSFIVASNAGLIQLLLINPILHGGRGDQIDPHD